MQIGGYKIGWSGNTITISPDRGTRGRKRVPIFGLGNAHITFFMDNVPTELLQAITDETTGVGLLPTSPFKLSRWYAMPEGVATKNLPLTGRGDRTWNMTFPQASAGSVKQVTAVDIIQNGYGVEEIVGDAPRLNW